MILKKILLNIFETDYPFQIIKKFIQTLCSKMRISFMACAFADVNHLEFLMWGSLKQLFYAENIPQEYI